MYITHTHVDACALVIISFTAGADPYYDAPGGRGTGVAMEAAERMMDIDRREHPAEGESTSRISIASKLQSFDYSHGSTNLKTVDYNHGTSSGAPAATQAYQDSAYPPPPFDVTGYGGAGAGGREAGGGYPYEAYRYPPPVGGGGYPPGAGSFLPSGLDAATLFAAYAGTPTSNLDPVHNTLYDKIIMHFPIYVYLILKLCSYFYYMTVKIAVMTA